MSDVSSEVGARMVDHMLKFAQGVCDVLEQENAEACLLAHPEKADELAVLLKRADCSLNRVRMLALWRKGQPPEEG